MNYFNKTFWQMFLGFVAIIVLGLISIYLLRLTK